MGQTPAVCKGASADAGDWQTVDYIRDRHHTLQTRPAEKDGLVPQLGIGQLVATSEHININVGLAIENDYFG